MHSKLLQKTIKLPIEYKNASKSITSVQKENTAENSLEKDKLLKNLG